MRLPRFSIGSLLAVIAILAVALAALHSPSCLWANVTFSLALSAMVVGIVNVIYGREAVRAYWLGFLLCGGIYFSLWSIPGVSDTFCPRLVTEVVLELLYPHLVPEVPKSSSVTIVTGNETINADESMLPTEGASVYVNPTSVLVTQFPMSPWIAWTEPDRVLVPIVGPTAASYHSPAAFRQIGHSMFTLLVAVLGGWFARHRCRTRVRDRAGLESAP